MTEPLGGIVAVIATLPVPEVALQVEAPLCVAHVHVGERRPVGRVSVMLAFVAVEGPEFDTTMSQVVDSPGFTDVLLSVLVIDKSPVGLRASVSVAVLFAEFESVNVLGALTVAVFASEPLAVGVTVPVTERVALEPAARETGTEIALPVPLAVEHDPAPVTVHVHVTPVSEAGTVSAMVAPATEEGPEFATTIA
jgi:hypothetical protein